MDRDARLFFQCVESMRTAEREYEKNPTDFNRGVMADMQNRCDGWLKWFHERERGKTKDALPPFIGRVPQGSAKVELSNDTVNYLLKTHTQEEIDRFVAMFG